jgi:hypothetical protein
MLYVKWLVLALTDILLLLTVPFAAPVVALFTKEQPHGQGTYKWGWLWGTYDNPPQGDEGYVKKRCPFPTVTVGWKGYVNRVMWMVRNPVYGFARWTALDYDADTVQHILGEDGISDKEAIPGWYFVRVYNIKTKKLVGFEFYGVFPYAFWKGRDLRVRLGWKILTTKFKERGFAPIVNTFNPFDGYGNS